MYKIKGKIDSNNALEFEKEIMAVKPNEIDASELEYISSAGLRVLLGTLQTIEGKGEMVVLNPSPAVMEVFVLTGFNRLFNIK
jgi:anti-anti-sigma factor